MTQITSWSYSAYSLWDGCAFAYKCAKILKLPDPKSKALEAGLAAHRETEGYLRGKTQVVPKVAAKFTWLLQELKQVPGLLIEQQWAFDRNWRESRWFKDDRTWLRSAIDVGVIYPDQVVELIDWKTGKQYETNQDQLELFALAAMVRYPETEKVITRLAYFDNGANVMDEFDAKDREALKAKWVAKVKPMFEDTVFAPKPSEKCRWCNFSKSKGGPCRFG